MFNFAVRHARPFSSLLHINNMKDVLIQHLKIQLLTSSWIGQIRVGSVLCLWPAGRVGWKQTRGHIRVAGNNDAGFGNSGWQVAYYRSLRISGGPRSCKRGAKVKRRPKKFWGGAMPPPEKKILILNLKLSNSSHSERHFLQFSYLLYTQKNTAFNRQWGHAPPPPGSATATKW